MSSSSTVNPPKADAIFLVIRPIVDGTATLSTLAWFFIFKQASGNPNLFEDLFGCSEEQIMHGIYDGVHNRIEVLKLWSNTSPSACDVFALLSFLTMSR